MKARLLVLLILFALPSLALDRCVIMREANIIGGGDAATLGIGALNADRWNGFYKDMVDCGALPAGWDVAKLVTTQFVNKKVAML